MSMDEAYCVVDSHPGATAIVHYTQPGAPLVRLLVAIQDSCISAEASAKWANVAHAGDQADELASRLVKSSPDYAEGRQQSIWWTNTDSEWKRALVTTASRIEALGGVSRPHASVA